VPRAHTARIRCSAPGSAALVAGALLALAASWLYSGAVALVVSVFAGALASGSSSDLAEVISNLIVPLGFAACFAVAVLRYRLYEIDRIISGEIWWAWSMKRSSPPTSRYGSPARLTGEQPPLTRREPEPRLTRP